MGLTGTLGAGKGTVVSLLEKKGFTHYSVRDFLKFYLSREEKEHTRDNMVELANRLRAENSPSYIAERLFEQASFSNQDAIIESLRTEGEINSLREKGDFYLLAIDADSKIRYERIQGRGSSTDNISYETFMEHEDREMISTDPNKQNLGACVALADYKIKNNGTLLQLKQNLEAVLNDIHKKRFS